MLDAVRLSSLAIEVRLSPVIWDVVPAILMAAMTF
jgi:hypothetical protein